MQFPPSRLPTGSALDNGSRRLAVITGSLASSYLMAIAAGAADLAAQAGYSTVSLAGGPLDNPDPIARARSQLFDIPDFRHFDAAVVVAGSLTRYLDGTECRRFMDRFHDLPTVSIGRVMEGMTSVTVDNTTGVQQLVAHLVSVHHCRRIAFVSGPKNHPSSDEKLRAYRQALLAHGIAFDPRLVVHGGLNRPDGSKCVAELFAQCEEAPEAIVAANDTLAFGVIDALNARGLRVPQGVLVVGCMGVSEGLFHEPALTTVKEPMYELGAIAAQAAIAILEGRAHAGGHIVVPTEMVTRRSCGCHALHLQDDAEEREGIEHELRPALITDRFTESVQKAAHGLDATLSARDIEDLVPLVRDAGSDTDFMPLLEKLDTILSRHLKETAGVAWLKALPTLQRELVLFFARHGNLDRMAGISRKIEQLMANALQKTTGYRLFESEKYVQSFRLLSISLNASFDVEEIRKLLREMGFTECYLNVYENPEDVQGRVRNIFSVMHGKLLELPAEARSYPASLLLPPGIGRYDDPYALMVLPLSFRAEPIGFMVLNLSDRKGVVYENIQSLLSSALKNESQLQELREAEEKFSDIAHSTSDWLWETDAQGRYTYCSNGVAEVLGYTAEEMLGRTLFDFLLPTETVYVSLVRSTLMPAMQALVNIENVNIHKNGHEVTLLISGKPIIKNGQLVGYRGAFKDTTEVKRQENRIRQLAYSDTLTGLPNRTLFNDRLEMVMAAARRESRRFAVLFLDLDRFKVVNDTLGHDAGDLLLQAVASRLGGCIRDVDTLARLGGDEFTIILAGADGEESVAGVARRIVAALAAPVEIRGHQLFITTSIGIAIFPDDGGDALTLLKNADKAMYKAKEQGKNRYVFYDSHMEEKSHRRMVLESLLHRALREHAFRLFYQPQVDVATGRICSAEALIRMNTSEYGVVSPAEFIPLAEEIGLIESIGQWVFEAACQQARLWRDAGHKLRIAINVSARQLMHAGMADAFIQAARRHGVAPEWMEIEITENAVIENEATAKEILQALADAGFTIAIDDFGTGYSSLSSLKKFPIDTVKIDRSFINDALTSPDSANIIDAIIHMARSLKLDVIAEGVETAEQLIFLEGLGCISMQGYYFSHPVPPEAFETLLAEGALAVVGEAFMRAPAGAG